MDKYRGSCDGDIIARLSGIPSLHQAELFLSMLSQGGFSVDNQHLLPHLRAAAQVLSETRNTTIPLLKYQPSSPTGKAMLLREARQLDGIANMVPGVFQYKARQVAAAMHSYAAMSGHPKSDPKLIDLRKEVQRLLNEEVLFP